ncbi:hypothetical protein [Haematobacter missouriensis]|uniref:Uncharacterized protein n=1 Tax=Haematobacter missouriensis TaxID=366616 RepID=A0A212AI75_9RHOB|nr:hypothetical protein [Haematobacter missouriensis]OWJ70432.1 hypothetical protein CDV53_20620 [Haematobacter missouriensis]OWJ81113.1 hypothetical protein CDV52_19455 [Haematobacter missouriensis]
MNKPQQTQSPEDASKDAFFARIAEVSEQMIAAHGKDFAMGTLVLAARWIASDKISGSPVQH